MIMVRLDKPGAKFPDFVAFVPIVDVLR